MDIHSKQDCYLTIQHIQTLLSSRIFEKENSGNLLQQSAFIDLMICMRDLLYKVEKNSNRISFSDGIIQNDYVHDVTDAVTAIRDACCHINSYKIIFDEQGNRGSYNVIYGKAKPIQVGDFIIESEYNDDIAFYYGKNRIYLKRHIIRAFNEACSSLEPLLKGI